MTDARRAHAPFPAHGELLQRFLGRRSEIVDRIQELLNAQHRPPDYLQNAHLLSRHFEDCFFTAGTISADQAHLRGQLQAAHWANGFRPRAVPGNDLVDPAQMMIRSFHFWQQTRWPGRNGRLRYAHTLFNLYLIRNLELLVMRIWDEADNGAAERLARIQTMLDRLWETSPTDQPVLVRDARWLIPLAQSPTTDDLAPYFEVARHVAEQLGADDRLEICKASVLMAGGHLRTQLYHYCLKKGVPLAENGLVLSSRNSNALDFAMTIQGLVPLLCAYEEGISHGDDRRRIELADVICQGVSADPELFVNRLDLLAPYTMIETLFTTTDQDGHGRYTPTGQRHVQLLEEYVTRMRRLAKPLHEDLARFRPVAGAYSPYGVIYGFSSNLTEHMAFKTLQSENIVPFSVEDVFADGAADTGKLGWVSGWRRLPHIRQDVQKMFEYPQTFAEDIFRRIDVALRIAAGVDEVTAAVKTGHLYIASDESIGDERIRALEDVPARYFVSADANGSSLLHDRQEGMFLVSYPADAGWVALTKDILTQLLGTGQDVRITNLPAAAAGILQLMCRQLARTVAR